MIAVCGSLQTRTWDDQDGKKRYAMDVVVDEAYFNGSAQNKDVYKRQVLQASPMGRPVYDRLGFLTAGPIRHWKLELE